MKLKVYLFGRLRLELNGNIIDLEELLGNQLSNVFALLVCNNEKGVTKNELIEKFWYDSENPANALKYAIFRLRNTLKQEPLLSVYNIVVTNKTGYTISDEFETELDVEEFETKYYLAKQNNSLGFYRECFDMYATFLDGLDSDWTVNERSHYLQQYLQLSAVLAKLYLDIYKNEDCMMVAKKALSYDKYNEELIYCYINSLIENKQYNEALKYYDNVSRSFKEEMGFKLNLKNKNLFDIISSKNKNIDKVDLFNNEKFLSAMYVDSKTFKSIITYEMRNKIREDNHRYVVFINSKKPGDIDKIITVIGVNLRLNDIYCKIDDYTIGLCMKLASKEDIDIVFKRLYAKFIDIVDKENISYEIKDL